KDTPPPPNGALDARAVSDRIIGVWNEDRKDREKIRATPKRVAHVGARLRDGFTPEQLESVVRKLKASPWHSGENDRGWKAPGPEFVLRSTEKVEEWIAREDRPRGKAAPGPRSLSEIDGQRDVFAGIDKLVPSAGAEE
ncbi:MAG: hypothetical protein LLG97_06900, partial [Deltaproteobacteria bacterium]|nr:hypothetical protein [Deltaproteobacteria bacterium]